MEEVVDNVLKERIHVGINAKTAIVLEHGEVNMLDNITLFYFSLQISGYPVIFSLSEVQLFK